MAQVREAVEKSKCAGGRRAARRSYFFEPFLELERFTADFLVEEVRLEAAAARLLALFFAGRLAEAFAPPRADERALDFFAARGEDFAADFLAADFFAAGLLAAVFLAGFLALFLALLLEALLAADFFAADFFAAGLLAAVFLAAVFLAALFFAPDLELLLALLFFVAFDAELVPFPPAPPAEF
jgi:hypothetical protein